MIHKFKSFIPQIDDASYIAPGSAVIGNVRIGRNSSVWHNAVIRGDVAEIVIGENSNVQDNCVLHCVDDVGLYIGNDVTVGHGAILHSCSIEDCSLVGMGAIVLDGVKIGKNCLIGAGAVVTPNTVVPEGSLVLGSPGKVKRQLTEEEIVHIKENAQEYVMLLQEYKKTV